MGLSTFASFLGIAKETTYGTPVAAAAYIPANTMTPEDVKNYVLDTANRGSAVESYGRYPTQGWSTYAFDGPVYMDTIGYALKGIFGAEDLSGAGPYTHKFGALNSGTFQPPSYTISDYNGFNARQFPGFMFTQVQFTMNPTALLTASVSGQGLASVTTSKPTQAFSAKTAIAGYKGAVSLAGSATTLVENLQLTLSRGVNPQTSINNSASPIAQWVGALTAAGQATLIYNDDSFETPMLNGTAVAVDVTYTNGADSLNLHCTNGIITKAPVSRGGNGWMEVTVDIGGDANTADANTAGGGYSPASATLVNSSSAAY